MIIPINTKGDVKVRSRIEPQLGRWVTTQRHEYKKYKEGKKTLVECSLMEKRIARLESIGFKWKKAVRGKGTK